MKAEMPKQGRKDRDNENRVLFGFSIWIFNAYYKENESIDRAGSRARLTMQPPGATPQ